MGWHICARVRVYQFKYRGCASIAVLSGHRRQRKRAGNQAASGRRCCHDFHHRGAQRQALAQTPLPASLSTCRRGPVHRDDSSGGVQLALPGDAHRPGRPSRERTRPGPILPGADRGRHSRGIPEDSRTGPRSQQRLAREFSHLMAHRTCWRLGAARRFRP